MDSEHDSMADIEFTEQQSTGTAHIVTEIQPLYIRVYQGRKSAEIGHEFLEFDVRYDPGKASHGLLRYANQSNYRNEELIRKEVAISKIVVEQILRMIKESEIMLENDSKWPKPDGEAAKLELEIRYGNKTVVLKSKRLGSVTECKHTDDPEGLKVFFFFTQNLKSFILSMISLHFKVRPV
ncbi:hypothetical protein CANARDRAFT_56238 [[Candida] arabinofermentans NRRL YB-2248]|uniref:Mago nashi protein n=1 Tax=[Candida] arabinofermentans NRRL YB-2248 TaxID=983967 RepID=A0A1E4T8H3_9ASCO|nr:hypothetical protein CANARDRAFT_56238 [[Candida] arabinofermentans NRRL YB-2248]